MAITTGGGIGVGIATTRSSLAGFGLAVWPEACFGAGGPIRLACEAFEVGAAGIIGIAVDTTFAVTFVSFTARTAQPPSVMATDAMAIVALASRTLCRFLFVETTADFDAVSDADGGTAANFGTGRCVRVGAVMLRVGFVVFGISNP